MEYRISQRQYPNKEFIQVNEILEKTIDRNMFVNMQKRLCPGYNQTCALFTQSGQLISHDGAHLTKYGALHIGNLIFHSEPLNRL